HNAGCIPYLPELWRSAVGQSAAAGVWRANLTYLELLARQAPDAWYRSWEQSGVRLVLRSVGTFVPPGERLTAVSLEVQALRQLSSQLGWLTLLPSASPAEVESACSSGRRVVMLLLE